MFIADWRYNQLMQQVLKSVALGVIVFVLTATTTLAATVTFTATRVVSMSDRHAPAEKLLKTPVRVISDQKLMLVPRIVESAPEYQTEQLRYTQLRLVHFQKIGSTVTHAKATGKIELENGDNTAVIEVTGNTDQTGRLTITTISADGNHKSQAVLEGYFY